MYYITPSLHLLFWAGWEHLYIRFPFVSHVPRMMVRSYTIFSFTMLVLNVSLFNKWHISGSSKYNISKCALYLWMWTNFCRIFTTPHYHGWVYLYIVLNLLYQYVHILLKTIISTYAWIKIETQASIMRFMLLLGYYSMKGMQHCMFYCVGTYLGSLYT